MSWQKLVIASLGLCLLASLTSCKEQLTKPEIVYEVVEPPPHRLEYLSVERVLLTGVDFVVYAINLEASNHQHNCDKYAVRVAVFNAKQKRGIEANPPETPPGAPCDSGPEDATDK